MQNFIFFQIKIKRFFSIKKNPNFFLFLSIILTIFRILIVLLIFLIFIITFLSNFIYMIVGSLFVHHNLFSIKIISVSSNIPFISYIFLSIFCIFQSTFYIVLFLVLTTFSMFPRFFFFLSILNILFLFFDILKQLPLFNGILITIMLIISKPFYYCYLYCLLLGHENNLIFCSMKLIFYMGCLTS